MAMQQFNIDGIRERYPNHWLLIAVTGVDEQGRPDNGKLIAYSKHRETILEFARQHAANSPDVEQFIFFTGEQNEISQMIENAGTHQSQVAPTDDGTEEQTAVDVPNWQDVYSRSPE
jgi:hypothetical protein